MKQAPELAMDDIKAANQLIDIHNKKELNMRWHKQLT